ncbi:MAG TPA: HAMP domain-containing sensor histidine kinase [Peptococcaceae bacterium]|nr:HAMP domain-containing sensor histidine kinase [Peptococcaceae bacterium]
MRRPLKILMSINSNPFAVKVVITVIAFAAVSCFIVMLELTRHFREVMTSLNIPKEIIDSSIAVFSQQLVITTVILTIIGVNGALLVAYFVTKPIRDLAEASKKIAQGDLSARVTTWGHDELAKLGQTFNQMADSIEKFTAEREALVKELMRNEQTRQELLKKVITAQEDERIRISRELHDETGQSLTSLIIGLKLLEDEINDPKQVQAISELRNLASTTLKEVHRLAVELRPTVLDDIGLIPAIERFNQTYARNYNIDIDFHVQQKNKERLSGEVETALYRIVQEGLTNIVKYAKAKNVSVLLDIRDTCVKLIVEDDGVGFDVEKVGYAEDRHLGIAGMKERTLLLNGSFTIESSPGQGTTIYVCIPLQRSGINEIANQAPPCG